MEQAVSLLRGRIKHPILHGRNNRKDTIAFFLRQLLMAHEEGWETFTSPHMISIHSRRDLY